MEAAIAFRVVISSEKTADLTLHFRSEPNRSESKRLPRANPQN